MTAGPPAARRPWPAAVVAVALAVAGLWFSVDRPLAPSAPSVAAPQEQFAPAVLEVVAAYHTPRLVYAVFGVVVAVAVPVALLTVPALRRRLLAAATRLRRPTAVGVALAVASVVAVRLVRVVPAFWMGHVREVDWGFRTAGPLDWWRDWLLSLGVEAATAAVAAAVLLWLLRGRPHDWHWWLPVAATGLAAVLVMLYPRVVEPLFLDTVPLAPGPVRDEVEAVLDRAGVEAEVLVGDASRRTTRINAFVTGLGPTRQVVLWDNLLARPADEVAVVVAHELAHREHADLPRSVLLTAAGVLPFALLLRRFAASPRVRAAVGAEDPADPRMVLAYVAAIAVAQAVSLPFANAVSQRAEAAADHAALVWTEAPDPMLRTWRGFVVRDLAEPDPPAVQMLLFGSHPPLQERIRRVVVEAERRGLDVADRTSLEATEREQHHRAIDDRDRRASAPGR